MNEDMTNLLQDTFSGTENPIHDLTVNVIFGKVFQQFVVHAFVLASSSTELAELIKQSKSQQSVSDSKIMIELRDVRPELFQQCLKYAYTRTCDLIEVGPCNFKIITELDEPKEINDEPLENSIRNMVIIDKQMMDENSSAYNVHQCSKEKRKKEAHAEKKVKAKGRKHSKEKRDHKNPLFLLAGLAERLGMHPLYKELANFKLIEKSIVDTRPQFWCRKNLAVRTTFTRKNYPEFYDIIIQSEDGEEFFAHRCILSARLEYFNSMFSLGWIETGRNRKLSLPIQSKVLSVLLEYIYKDEAPLLNKSHDVEFVCQLLAVADQLLGKSK